MWPVNAGDTIHEFKVELIGRVKNGDVQAVKSLLRDRADITEDMLAPSMVSAAADCQTEMVRLLIAAGANVNNKNSVGSTPLMVAAFWGYTETARLLIDSGADLDLVDEDGQTALMRAALAGQTEMARLLIDRGVDLNMQSPGGETACSLALSNGHKEITQLIERACNKHHVAAFGNQRRLNVRAFKPKIIGRPQP